MKTTLFFLLFFTAFLFTQCTVEKRLYTKGWSVEWRHRYKPVQQEEEQAARIADVKQTDSGSPVENTALLSKEEILQLQIAVSQQLPHAVEDEQPAMLPDKIVVPERKNRVVAQSEIELPRVSEEKKTEEEKRDRAVVVSAIVLGAALIGIVIGFIGVSASMSIGGEVLFFAAILLCIGVAIVSLILLFTTISKRNAFRDGTLVPEPEKSPEETVRLKRKRSVAMGIFFAAIAAIIIAIKGS